MATDCPAQGRGPSTPPQRAPSQIAPPSVSFQCLASKSAPTYFLSTSLRTRVSRSTKLAHIRPVPRITPTAAPPTSSSQSWRHSRLMTAWGTRKKKWCDNSLNVARRRKKWCDNSPNGARRRRKSTYYTSRWIITRRSSIKKILIWNLSYLASGSHCKYSISIF